MEQHERFGAFDMQHAAQTRLEVAVPAIPSSDRAEILVECGQVGTGAAVSLEIAEGEVAAQHRIEPREPVGRGRVRLLEEDGEQVHCPVGGFARGADGGRAVLVAQKDAAPGGHARTQVGVDDLARGVGDVAVGAAHVVADGPAAVPRGAVVRRGVQVQVARRRQHRRHGVEQRGLAGTGCPGDERAPPVDGERVVAAKGSPVGKVDAR